MAATGADFRTRFPAPDAHWTQQWWTICDALVSEALGSEELQARFAGGLPLPEGYGVAMDERVIEWPWALAQRPSGRLLDAGSALNHAKVLPFFAPLLSELQIFTLEPEEHAFWKARISYVYGDLRDMPYRDGWFDHVISVSTLEHVGMNNELYGSNVAASADAGRELRRAVGEIMRVLRPGGTFGCTVPYGVAENFGTHRTFDRPAVEELVDATGADDVAITVYRYDGLDGWQVSTLEDAADVRYREFSRDPNPADMAAAARAVACVRVVKPQR